LLYTDGRSAPAKDIIYSRVSRGVGVRESKAKLSQL
jgi:hypothetical protein